MRTSYAEFVFEYSDSCNWIIKCLKAETMSSYPLRLPADDQEMCVNECENDLWSPAPLMAFQ